jgi:glycosyltransferase involved in cell wall biosynthesis/ribosomal protein S18 acetylase RimI-like enzyme
MSPVWAAKRAPQWMTSSTPRVVHITTTDISLELLLGPQLEAFGRAGFEVVGASAPGPYVDALARRGVGHVALRHATRSVAPFEDGQALFELVGLLRRLRPAIVHTHNPKPGLYGRVAARIAGVPVVVNTLHGLYALPEDPGPKRAFVYALERLAATCSQAELVQNPEDVIVLRRLGVPETKLAVLGNGIDLSRFDPASIGTDDKEVARLELGATVPSDVVVGVVGRLVREKGLPEVLEAAQRLRHHRPELRFAVIGPEEPHKTGSLRREDRAAAVAAGVRFLGSRDDVVRLYRGMDLYVLASHREGFPRSAMEAASMGLPIVATDIRGCRQVVDPGVTGLLVPARDPAALTEAIAGLAADPDRRLRMGAAGREKAIREFDQQRCIDLTLSIYRRLLTQAGIPAPREHAQSTNAPVAARLRAARPAALSDAPSVARLHVDRFPHGFLPRLGSRPLRRLYRHLIRSANAFVLVADDAEGIAGYIAVSEDTRRLYREFLRRDGAAAALIAAPAALRAPRRVWETLRYGGRADNADLPSAEILAVAVAQRARGTGVASMLLAAALSELRRRGVGAARVVTASGNAQALRVYERAGFQRRRVTEVHRGVRQEVLVWP